MPRGRDPQGRAGSTRMAGPCRLRVSVPGSLVRLQGGVAFGDMLSAHSSVEF